ncbi:MAG: hypothetical protein JW819_12380 [Candidatus Krumholzibacteriota bacterium]|nr:hypothetical protein [Candidatus Krumholzibacteriota bacterium]
MRRTTITLSLLAALALLLAGAAPAAAQALGDAGIAAGDSSGTGGYRSLCGEDNRLPAYTGCIGRVLGGPWGSPAGTAYIIANGALLTAGHVPTDGPYGGKVEFHVPLSGSDGTAGHPANQYVFDIDQSSIVGESDGDPAVGRDWKIFRCHPNSETGALVGTFGIIRLALPADLPPVDVTVNGYGDDDGVFNNTEQDDTGPYLGEHVEASDDVWLEYIVDTMGGNSGSPILLYGTYVSVGIHTDAGCDPPDAGNKGTSFTNSALADALADYLGAPAVYVDGDHPATLEDGTIFRPYDTLTEAAAAAPAGAIINIVEGLYGDTPSISTPMTLTAPVGEVYLGYQGSREED